MNRLNFIKNTSLATAGITILNFPVFGKNTPSNKVVVAIMGVNSRGAYLAKCFSQLANVEIAYICDVEDKAIANGMKPFANAARQPTVIKDIRELVNKKDFDALVVAAPDHWHAPAAILGVAHGKHVYVEKPCGHNPYEGELLIQAMNKYSKQLIQMGNQRRSMPNLIEAVKQVKQGIIGNAYFAKAWYANNRKSIGYGTKIAVPTTLDFELWQGPAPRRDYKSNLIHYNWHWFWHWGTGEALNNGTHELDVMRWGLAVDFPTKVVSAGGRYAFQDDWETPDTQTISYNFGNDKAMTWEGRSCNGYESEGSGRGVIFHGEKGTLVYPGANSYSIYDTKNKLVAQVKDETPYDATNTVSPLEKLDSFHLQNFVNAIREQEKLTAEITEGHKSTLLPQLGNIAYRVGRTLNCDPQTGRIINDAEAMKFWSREYEKGWNVSV